MLKSKEGKRRRFKGEQKGVPLELTLCMKAKI
jgi:hypothetical protein